MNLLIIVESLSGNTMSFVERIQEKNRNWHIKVIGPQELDSNILSHSWNKVMIGCYTWSNGKIPIRTKRIVIEQRDWFLKQDLLIFGSGWSVYENYCGAVDGLGIILENNRKIKFELAYDAEVELEAEQTLKQYLEETENDYTN